MIGEIKYCDFCGREVRSELLYIIRNKNRLNYPFVYGCFLCRNRKLKGYVYKKSLKKWIKPKEDLSTISNLRIL